MNRQIHGSRSVLVTGGAGFIGSRVVHYLAKHLNPSAKIHVFDKLTYAAELARIQALLDSGRVQLTVGDVADVPSLTEVLELSFDGVIHCAAETHVDRSIDAPSDFIRTNITGTFNLLQAQVAGLFSRLTLVSTDEVYGDGADEGAGGAEPTGGLRASSPYAASKASADLLAQSYHRTFSSEVLITRASNAYGVYQHPEKFIPLSMARLMGGLPIPLYGDGSQLRDWLHVNDHAAGICAAHLSGSSGEIYHLCSGAMRSNFTVMMAVAKALEGQGISLPEPIFERVPDRPGHDRRYTIDANAKYRPPGWQPEVIWPEAMVDLAKWAIANRPWLTGSLKGLPRWLSAKQQP